MISIGTKQSIMKWRVANTIAYNEYMCDYMRQRYTNDNVKQKRMERYYTSVAFAKEVKRFCKINCF